VQTATPAAEESRAAFAPRHRAVATTVLIFAAFMDLIDATIVNVALPSIRADLGASAAHLEWVVSAYLLVFAVLLVTGGRLGDIYGRRRVFVTGVVGFTLCSLAAALAPSPMALVTTRAGQGAFAALMAPQLLSSIQVLYRPRERPAVYGAVGAVTGFAAVIGPLLGGWLVTADLWGSGWRAIFAINLPIGVIITVAALMFVPNSTSDRPLRLDWPGVVLATAGLLLVAYPLVQGREHGWPWWTWAMFASAAVVLAAFVRYQVRRERRDGSSLLPMRLFLNRGYSAGLIVQSSFQFSLASLVLMLTIYLQTGVGFTAIGAGLAYLPFSLGAIVGTTIAVPTGVRLGRVVVLAGALTLAGSTWWLVRVVADHAARLSGWDLAPALAAGGVGLGLVVVPLVDIALATVSPDDAGAASGAYGTMQQIGAALGVAVVGVVFFGVVGSTYTQARLEDGIRAGVWVPVIGYLVCAAATLLLPSRADVRAHAARERDKLQDAAAQT
jgi:EmrB/QacA subfamily drug resistance transporter